MLVLDDRRVTDHLGLDLLSQGAVGRNDALHVVRKVARSTVRDRGDHLRHLQRRDGDVPLPDRRRHGLARHPRPLEPAQLPLRVGNDARLLVLQADARRRAQAEAARPRRDGVDPEPLAELVEEHVARLDDRLVKGDRPVSAVPPAAEEVIAERHAAAAVDARLRSDGALLEAGGRHHHLEGRSRRILSLDGAIVQRLQRVLHQRAPLGRLDAAREQVGVVRRPATPAPAPRRCADRARRPLRCDRRALAPPPAADRGRW